MSEAISYLDTLRLLVVATRGSVLNTEWGVVPPEPGDLVVEITGWIHPPDPDGIGWLVAKGDAPYREDGKGAQRYIYDVLPLNPHATLQAWGGQRWENAVFSKLPDHWLRLLGARPPLALFGLIEQRADPDPDEEDS